jgi:hypothetical protein
MLLPKEHVYNMQGTAFGGNMLGQCRYSNDAVLVSLLGFLWLVLTITS